MNSSEKTNNLCAALVKAQAEMGGAVKDSKNPFFKSNYADLTSVIKAVKEPFANHGLGYIQFPINDGHSVGVVTRLIHESGEWIEQDFSTPLQKVDPQSVGALISYYRRFCLQSMAGIPSVEDDGEMAVVRSESANLSPSEVKVLKDLITQTNTDSKKFCQAYNIKSVDELPKKQFHHAKNALERRSK
jgi:hypothetical protein